MEEKRNRSSEGDEVEGSTQKKRPQGAKEVPKKKRPGIHTRSKPAKTKFVPSGFSPVPEKVWRETVVHDCSLPHSSDGYGKGVFKPFKNHK